MKFQTFDSYSVNGFTELTGPVRKYDVSTGVPIVSILDREWYPPWERDMMHEHNCYEFGLCVSGSGQIYIGERMYPFTRSTIVAVPPGVRHCQINDGNEPVRWRYLLCDGHALLEETQQRLKEETQSNLDRLKGGVCYPAELCSEVMIHHVERFFRICHRTKQINGSEADATMRLFLVWLSQIGEIDLPLKSETNLDVFGASVIQPAILFISQNYQREMRVDDLASACNVSESYFRRVFEETMQMSPMEYVNRFRTNRAIYLLKNTDEQISAVAEQAGYPSITTFNRNFKKYTGMTAQVWRQRDRENRYGRK